MLHTLIITTWQEYQSGMKKGRVLIAVTMCNKHTVHYNIFGLTYENMQYIMKISINSKICRVQCLLNAKCWQTTECGTICWHVHNYTHKQNTKWYVSAIIKKGKSTERGMHTQNWKAWPEERHSIFNGLVQYNRS